MLKRLPLVLGWVLSMMISPESWASPQSGSAEALLNEALTTAPLSRQDAKFEPSVFSLFRQGEFTSTIYTAIMPNPWDLPRIMQARKRDLIENAARPSELINLMGGMVGNGTRRSLLGNPVAYAESLGNRDDSFRDVLNKLIERKLVSGRVPSTAGVPINVQKAAATLLNVALRTVEMRRLALADNPDPKRLFKLVSAGRIDDEDLGLNFELTREYRKLNPQYLGMAAHDLTLAVQGVKESLKSVPPTEKFQFRMRTVWGLIRLSGGTNETYDDEPNLLTIDTGGNDIYLNGPSTTSIENWLSISIDTNGDDQYVSDKALRSTAIKDWSGRKSGDRPGPGGAVLGVSILLDSTGNDLYRSHRPGLGSAKIGTSVLWDEDGNDTYDSYTDSQGFGMFGTGILVDSAGTDTYSGFNEIQGVGLTGGSGLLLDVSGNDRYLANDDLIDFPSAQSTQHNVSMAQGAGNGRRADYLDGLSYAGGVGILLDGSGDDQYSAGVFAQGVGYWMGMGSLLDLGGTDTYSGQWYVQGAAAHFALGYLDDASGDDRYESKLNISMGVGHDFGYGLLVDHSGNDRYQAPNLSLGAGNANGIGCFIDVTGDDQYTLTGQGLGFTAGATKGTLRERTFSLGMFLDGAGRDTYAGRAAAKDEVKIVDVVDANSLVSQTQVNYFWDK